ncbi:VOC family protein [Klugiella xanthotipulae]|uniref:VOC domain-containing protein n=1 Tax=Klugiella xanthotipulae TaxID=244735 RepID=A0A543HYE4_9MICO|nr:VOC family protein [Klugiella xanthotipulae]TQM63265.1 polar amino acid transport system ATP-binding protein/hypothetical protein [Klugiella xanthotipulae]
MSPTLFVNLPVTNLAAATEFYRGLGFSLDGRFTDENAASVIVSDTIMVMLLTEESFARFTDKQIINSNTHIEVITSLGLASRAEVDALADRAYAMGAIAPKDPTDEGFLYLRTFQDPDGHAWEVCYLDESAIPEGALPAGTDPASE